MRFYEYYFPIFVSPSQIYLLVFFIFLYLIFLFFNKNKKRSLETQIFIFFSFVYWYFLINLSFLPFHQISEKNILDSINIIPFSTIWENKKDFLSVIILIPFGFFVSYFSKNFYKNIIFGVCIAILIEFLQLLILYFSIKNWFWSLRPFTIDDMILRFFWILIWIFIYNLFKKIFKK